MKRCSKCKQLKHKNNFGKNKKAKDGLNYYCKSCNVLHVKEYRLNHPKYRQNYWEKNRRKIRKYKLEYNRKNRDKKAKWDRTYEEKHRAELNIKKREYVIKNKEQRKRTLKKYVKNHPLQIKKNKAKRRNFYFIPLFLNPFPSEVDVDYHHLNKILVIPLPRTIHRQVGGKKHWDNALEEIKRIYCLDLRKILYEV